jgi:signal transduction histidine kinase
VQFERQPQQVADLVCGALRWLELEDREVQVEVAVEISEVLAYRQLLESVIRHLIGNSLKYAEPQSPLAIRRSSTFAE